MKDDPGTPNPRDQQKLIMQPYGLVFIVHKDDLTILHIGSNSSKILNKAPECFVGKKIINFLDNTTQKHFKENLQQQNFSEINPFEISIQTDNEIYTMEAQLYAWGEWVLLEAEPKAIDKQEYISTFYKYVRHASITLQHKHTLTDVYDSSVKMIRELTGFKHILFIQLNEFFKGKVVGECTHNGEYMFLDEYLAEFDYSVINQKIDPQQFINYIPDVSFTTIDLYPDLQLSSEQLTNRPSGLIVDVDSGFLQYLKDFNINAYLGINLYINGKLWGRISCYHDRPKPLSLATREAASFLGEQIASVIALKLVENFNYHNATFKELHARIAEAMSTQEFYLNGLRKEYDTLLQLMGADGIAWNLENSIETYGNAPSVTRIEKIVDWAFNVFNGKNGVTYHTNYLLNEEIKFKSIKLEASGILFLPIILEERKYIIWFRPEKIIVDNIFESNQSEKNKRGKKFIDTNKLIKQSIGGRSDPWEDDVINNAVKLKNNIVHYIYQNSERLKSLNVRLEKLVKERTHILEQEIRMRKKAEDTIQQSLIALQHSNKELESFAYIASHDLQEPLRKIQAFGDRLKQLLNTSIDDKSKDYLQRMMGAADRMQRLINDLLSYSRVTTQTQPFTEINLDDVLKNVISDLHLIIDEKAAKINVDNFGNITGDETQLHRLFLNLIQNALKFNKPNTAPKISIKNNSDNKFCRMEIIDNGIGFDTSYSEKIFNLFERLHSRTEYEGTGLGLSICKKIVDRHNGNISSKSKKGQGAQFTIELPFHS